VLKRMLQNGEEEGNEGENLEAKLKALSPGVLGLEEGKYFDIYYIDKMPGFLHRLSGKFQISRKIRTQNFKIQTQTIQTNTQIHILEDFGSINNSVMCRTLPTSVNSLWSASTKGLVQKLVVVLLSFNPPPAIRFLTCPCLLH